MPLPDYQLTVYCADPSHTDAQIGPFIVARSGREHLAADEAVKKADGVFAIAVMELNRSTDDLLVNQMHRGADTFGLWTIATSVPAHYAALNRPRRKNAEMVTLYDEEGSEGRLWIRLRCGFCDKPYERRMPQFCDQLDTLARNGIAAVSLRTLRDKRI